MLSTLGVTIDRLQVLEYAGDGAANVKIERFDANGDLTTSGALEVTLTSSDTSEIRVQGIVTIPDGASSVDVPLDVIDDTLLDGTQTVTITASADGFSDGGDTIDVRDIETLSLTVNGDSLAIGGELTTATLTRGNTDVGSPLLVNIQYENASDLDIPAQFEIPAGQQSTLIPISTTDNGLVEGTRTVQLVVFADGYLNGSDTLEIREDGIVGVDVAADGQAIDIDEDGTFSRIVTTGLSEETRDAVRDRRALFEFDISSISGPLEAASLTLRVQGYSASQGVGPTVEIFGYVGDGSLSSADALAGRKVGEFQVHGVNGVRRYGIPLDLAFLQPLIDTEQYVGFSARIAQGNYARFSSSRNTFTHESNHPMLQFALTTQSSPTAVNDVISTNEDVAATIDVLNNDFGDSLTVDSVGLASHGAVVINADQTVTYSPVADYNGNDSFVYTLRDVNGDTDTATVTVTVNSVNDAPIAVDDTAVTNEDTAVVIDVLANDSDVDNDTLSIDRVTQPSNGTVVVNADDTVIYTPDTDFHGTNTFVYSMTDGNGSFKRAFVTVVVAAVNDDPVAGDDAATTAEDTAVTINVLANDSDV
ncbi:MAG: tandem-95 repeat protein, partial [Planctomycetes bacterium]|nr:tandem-95 repeat protein [Planctomycetota bacterium]